MSKRITRFSITAGLMLLLSAGAVAAEGLYDPTRPLAGVAAAPAGEQAVAVPLTVNFIISASQRRLARINDQWVREGDRVAGAEIIRIAPGYVRLRREGRLFDLPLQDGGVKKRPSQPAG